MTYEIKQYIVETTKIRLLVHACDADKAIQLVCDVEYCPESAIKSVARQRDNNAENPYLKLPGFGLRVHHARQALLKYARTYPFTYGVLIIALRTGMLTLLYGR